MSRTALSHFLPISRTLRLLIVCLLALTASPLKAAGIVVLLSEPAPAYLAYAQGFRASLEKRGSSIEIQILDLSQVANQALPEASLLIAVGSRAAEALSARNLHQPLLLAMLPKTNLDRLLNPHARIGGVYIDQPAARYIALARAAIPDLEHIGLLIGRDSKDSAARLMSAARDARLRAHAETVSSEADIYPAMQRMFADGGALLATPDTSVFNSQSIPSILLSAYRRGVPVIGFSPAYITAGAAVALYSTPEQLAAQSVDISLQFLAGGAMPAPQYPRHYTIGVNERVARSLGLSLEGEALIRDRLERLERQP